MKRWSHLVNQPRYKFFMFMSLFFGESLMIALSFPLSIFMTLLPGDPVPHTPLVEALFSTGIILGLMGMVPLLLHVKLFKGCPMEMHLMMTRYERWFLLANMAVQIGTILLLVALVFFERYHAWLLYEWKLVFPLTFPSLVLCCLVLSGEEDVAHSPSTELEGNELLLEEEKSVNVFPNIVAIV